MGIDKGKIQNIGRSVRKHYRPLLTAVAVLTGDILLYFLARMSGRAPSSLSFSSLVSASCLIVLPFFGLYFGYEIAFSRIGRLRAEGGGHRKRTEQVIPSAAMSKIQDDAGFTLIELAVVLFILGFLMTLWMTHNNGSINSAYDMGTKQQIMELEQTAHDYAANTAGQVGGTYYGLGSFTAGGYVAGQTSILPSLYTTSGLQNPFKGYGILTEDQGNPNLAEIIETGLPSADCSQIANSLAAHAQVSCSGGTLTVIFQ